MQKYFNNVVNRTGDVIPGALVTVTNTATGALASLFSDDGVTSTANPVVTDSNGFFSFFTDFGRYTLTISGGGVGTLTIPDVTLEDATVEAADAAASAAAAAASAAAAEAAAVFVQAGTGAVTRTIQNKSREIVSVKDFGAVGDGVADDTAEIQAAVTAAIAADSQLYWPAGDYLTTASIPSLHLVRHSGPGVIVRGASTFYVQPREGQTNTLYVRASGGSSLSDALSNAEGIPSVQAAFNILENYWPLDGKWVIEVGAGTYTGTAAVSRLGPPNSNSTADGMFMRNAITIKGPDVGYDATSNPTPTPTAIFDAAGAAAVGIQLERGIKARLMDVKFVNYTGSASSVGAVIDNGSWLQAVNVHADNCFEGLGAINHSLLDVKGGTLNNCTRGIRSLFSSKHEIGNQTAGAAGQGPFITNCTTGFLAQECSTGHADYCTFTSNGTAIDIQVNARVNSTGSDFKLNTVAIRAGSGSNVFPLGVVWNTGTANANTENIRIQDAGSIAAQNSNFWRAIGRQTTTATVTGIATNSVVWTGTLAADLYTSVPGPTYLGKAIRVTAGGSISGTAGTKNVQLRLGGNLLGGIVFDAANNGSFFFEGIVYLTGSAAQKTVCRSQTGIGVGTEAAYATTTFNTASSTDLSLTLTTSLSAADTINFEVVDFEVQG